MKISGLRTIRHQETARYYFDPLQKPIVTGRSDPEWNHWYISDKVSHAKRSAYAGPSRRLSNSTTS